MWNSIYPYVYLALLMSILAWFYTDYKAEREKKTWAKLSFWASAITYAITMFQTEFSFFYKILGMLPRDIGVILGLALIANNLKSSRGFFITAIAAGLGTYLLFSSFVPDTYQKYFGVSSSATRRLDKDAELLIDMKNVGDAEKVRKILAQYNATLSPAFPDLKNKSFSELDDFFVINLPNNDEAILQKVKTVLQNEGYADAIEYNEMVSLSPLEKQSVSAKKNARKYPLDDPQIDQLWSFEAMKMDEFYQYIKEKGIKPRKKVKIAILDTGIDSEHEDIKAKYTSTRSEYNKDKQSHGTHCAGIAASVSNNGVGIASFSPNNNFVTVTSIKVLSDEGWGTDAGIIRGIIEAADGGADVISMSLGGYSNDDKQRAFSEAVRYAQKSGAIVIVAAGNESTDARKVSPANAEGVIVVSAVDAQLKMATFSNYITHLKMGIAAPGVEILSTTPNNSYAAYSGTSMATPYVAGLVAMMKSIRPELTTEQVYAILKNTGIDTGDTDKTGKFIQPLKVIQALQ
ncbi:MAG: subtilisin [Cytophagales bacterium]|nr:MAG: subtilisin [Cytophagales bacterium]